MHAVVDYIDRHLDQKLDLGSAGRRRQFLAFPFPSTVPCTHGRGARRLRAAPPARVAGDSPARAAACLGAEHRTRRRLRLRRSVHARVPREIRLLADAMAKEQARSDGAQGAVRLRRQARRKNGGSRIQGDRHERHDHRTPACPRRLPAPHRRLTARAIGRFWMETVAPWMATNNLFGRERFGIGLDDPSVTKPAQCRYDACVGKPRRRGAERQPAATR